MEGVNDLNGLRVISKAFAVRLILQKCSWCKVVGSIDRSSSDFNTRPLHSNPKPSGLRPWPKHASLHALYNGRYSAVIMNWTCYVAIPDSFSLYLQ